MSDIFISYAREDKAMAEALAGDLKARGFQVWWDAELVGSDDFYDVILEALNKAKAAIVIWTKASAKSRFVRDEARFALHLEKLVAVRDPKLDPLQIPFGFQCQHTDDVGNREHIVKAVEKLGVSPAAANPATPIGVSNPERMKTASLDDIVAYLGTSPPEAGRLAAFARLKDIAQAPKAESQGGSEIVRSLQMSNFQAFLSGLTFRVPDFQLATQGAWASIGIAMAYIAILAVIRWLIMSNDFWIDYWHQPEPGVHYWSQPNRIISEALSLALFLVISWLLWRGVRSFAAARTFDAAAILSVAFAVCLFMTAGSLFLFAHFKIFWPASESYILTERLPYNDANRLAFSLAGAAFSVALVIWKIRASR